MISNIHSTTSRTSDLQMATPVKANKIDDRNCQTPPRTRGTPVATPQRSSRGRCDHGHEDSTPHWSHGRPSSLKPCAKVRSHSVHDFITTPVRQRLEFSPARPASPAARNFRNARTLLDPRLHCTSPPKAQVTEAYEEKNKVYDHEADSAFEIPLASATFLSSLDIVDPRLKATSESRHARPEDGERSRLLELQSFGEKRRRLSTVGDVGTSRTLFA